ncbi:hypothetical protein [Novosphingobium lentum]|uniref:hypothetical protein n=1 Tax=Novosphingobium lentum TaxID=145287 RepID=UPI00082EC71F|nr:hypothetical protein [Novosphingobium lentum]
MTHDWAFEADGHFAEQFPLSPLDDHLIHQTPDPIRVAYTTDPRFFERHWNVFHDQTGDLMVATGGSFYPNLDTAEAYAIVTLRGVQTAVRAFRRIGANRGNIHVGPIQPTIVSGMREWRHVLAQNAMGIGFDLTWYDTHRQMYRAAYGSLDHGTPAGGQRHVTAGFESFGEVHGWVQVGNERIELSRAEGRGTRDRHWGIGRGVGGPRFQADGTAPKAGWIGGNWVQFADFAIWGPIVLYRYGDARARHGKVRKVDRRLRFEPDTKVFLEGEIDYTLDDGSVKRVHYERIGNQTVYMTSGLYGGSPDGTIWQGDFIGENVVQGDRFDLTDPAVRLRLRGLDEHHCRIRCDGEETTGILQPLEPDAYEACARGEKGWSLL